MTKIGVVTDNSVMKYYKLKYFMGERHFGNCRRSHQYWIRQIRCKCIYSVIFIFHVEIGIKGCSKQKEINHG